MKKKWLKKVFLMLTASAMALSVAACKSENAGKEGDVEFTIDPAASVYETELEEVPESWNPHTWYSAIDMVMLEYLVTPIVASIPGGDGAVNFVPMAATEVTDITAGFADKGKWGIEGDEGYVFQLDLNPLMTWEDGTSITAKTYVDSMKTLLRSDMDNYRAGRYSVGAEAIRNAYGYSNSDKAGQPFYANALDVDFDDNTTLYFNPTQPCFFFGNASMEYYYNSGYDFMFYNDQDENIFEKYMSYGGYIEITDEFIDELTGLALSFGDDNPDAWYEFCFAIDGVYDSVSWDDVGIYADGDYRLIMVMENPMSMQAFNSLMKRNWIVNDKAYQEGMAASGSYMATPYNTVDGKTMSFGPYKVANINVDDAIVLEKNEKWYGWADGDHTGLYTYEEFGDYDYVRINLPKPMVSRLDSIPLNDVHPFPYAFEAENAFGEVITQDDIGEKELFFVHLWATWCGPCVNEMGDLATVANTYGDRVGFIALCTDLDSNAKGAARLAEANEVPFDSIFPGIPALEELYQMLRSGYVPTTILIDGEGNIIGEQIVGEYGLFYGAFIEDALEAIGK